jgi:hypothetical protein
VRLAARALISESDLESLMDLVLTDSVEVTRVGISDAPRRMRFDYVWGERPEGSAVAVTCIDVGRPRVTVAGITGLDMTMELIGTLRNMGLLLGPALDTFFQRGHSVRWVGSVDGWPLMT